MHSLTATDIAWHMRLFAQAQGHAWITPNVQYYAWESDLLTVTPQGHVCEVEIKISRSDLKQDLLKPKHHQGMLQDGAFLNKLVGVSPTLCEARELARQREGATECRRPTYFCFAMPCEIYRRPRPMVLPSYAGIYTVDEEGRVFEERRPIQLHQQRLSTEDLLDLARRMHHRYWEELRRLERKSPPAS